MVIKSKLLFDGIPRLLDMGQCNNAYSAIQVAVTLAKVFNCDVNDNGV